MWGTQIYYIRKPEYKDAFYGVPERATVYDIDWYCNEYEYDFDKFVDAYFDVDDRTDEEIVRDKVRPAKDVVYDANNYMSQFYGRWDEVDYDDLYEKLEKRLNLDTATAKELFDISDYSRLWFRTEELSDINRGNEDGAKEMRVRRTVMEDLLYEAIYNACREEVKKL